MLHTSAKHAQRVKNECKQTPHDQLFRSTKCSKSSIRNRILLLIRTACKSPAETRRWTVRTEILRNAAVSCGVSKRTGLELWL